MISIYGSEDGVLNREKYAEYRRNLPAAFEEHIIQGGCHAGFGSYGPQDGDGVPTITGEEQIAETARLLTAFFKKYTGMISFYDLHGICRGGFSLFWRRFFFHTVARVY